MKQGVRKKGDEVAVTGPDRSTVFSQRRCSEDKALVALKRPQVAVPKRPDAPPLRPTIPSSRVTTVDGTNPGVSSTPPCNIALVLPAIVIPTSRCLWSKLHRRRTHLHERFTSENVFKVLLRVFVERKRQKGRQVRNGNVCVREEDTERHRGRKPL